MRRPFLTVLLACGAFLLVFFGVGTVLNDSWEVTTTVRVEAPPARVVAQLTDLAGWKDWCTVDANLGPGTERTVAGEPGRTGSLLRWKGAEGEATLTLTEVGPAGATYEFAMVDRGVLGTGGIAVEPADGGSQVTWRDQGRLTNLASRWVAWFGAVQEAVRKQQQASLANLARRLEPAPPQPK